MVSRPQPNTFFLTVSDYAQGLMYNTAVTLFFVPYALLEVPSNIVLKILRPSLWMSILLFSWGLVMTLATLFHARCSCF